MIKNSALGANVIDRHISLGAVAVPKLRQQINDGVSLILHIGHGVGSSLVYDFHEPSYYSNEGKYPFFLSTSCFVGNIHSISSTMAIDHVVADKKGMIGFMSYVSFGFPAFANVYNKELIRQFSSDNYDKPLGFCIKKTIEKLYQPTQDNLIGKVVKVTCQDFTLSGDPAIRLYAKPKPDYSLKLEDMQFFNSTTNEVLPIDNNITLIPEEATEVGLSFVLHNYGKVIEDSLKIKITGLLPNGNTKQLITKKIAAPTFQDTIRWMIPNDTTLKGKTYLVVNIDPNQDIVETCESNNIIAKTFQYGQDCTAIPLTIENANKTYCLNQDNISLTGMPTGGVFSSPNLTIVENKIEINSDVSAGTYPIVYTYQTAGGCKYEKTTALTLIEELAINMEAHQTVCSADLPFTLKVPTELAGLTYQWSTGSTNNHIEINTAGTYTLTVQNEHACSTTKEIIVEVTTAPVVNLGEDKVVCREELPIILSTLTEANGSMAYQWSTGVQSSNLTIVTGGTYRVTVTNAQGCKAVDAITISEATPMEVAMESTQQVRKEELPITLDAGTWGEATTYQWSTGEKTQTIEVEEAGVYDVTLINSQGCLTHESIEVVIITNPIIALGKDKVICEDDLPLLLSPTITGIENPSYSWSTGETSSQIKIYESGIYKVVVTSPDGFVATDEVNVKVVNAPLLNIMSTTEICESDLPYELTIKNTTEDVVYNWSTGDIGKKTTITEEGMYELQALNANGCIATLNVQINIVEEPAIDLAENISVLAKDLPLELRPGNFKDYSWSDGSKDAATTVYRPGIYGLTVTDSNNCKAKSKVNVTLDKSETKPTLAESITIFPNPVAHNLIISGNVFGTIDMSLYNLNGRLIIQIPLSGFESRYNMDHLTTGTYLLRLQYKDDVLSETIIKH